MGIYIESMEMPNSCLFCPLNSMKQCRITGGDITWATAARSRRGDCPLVSVQPNGNLIESKAFLKAAHETDDFSLDEAVLVAATPITIPADESNMDSFIHIFEEDDEEDGMDSFIRILKD